MFPVPTLYVSNRVPSSIHLLQQLQNHREFSTIRIVYVHNVRMEHGLFRAYDAENNVISLPPGVTGIPSFLSVTSNMASVLSGAPAILSHFGGSVIEKIAKSQSTDSGIVSAPFVSSSASTAPKVATPPVPVYNPNIPGINYNRETTVSEPPQPIHVPSETEKKAALNAAKLEEYNRKSQSTSYSY